MLGENLRAFEPRGRLCGPDDLEAAPSKYVDNARDQRRFRTNDRQIDTLRFGEVRVTLDILLELAHSALAIPGLPGEATMLVTLGDWASRQASACSRPPPPTIRIFNRSVPQLKYDAMQKKYDVVVVGAGHAGCEAARACARLGLKTAMVTMNLDLIAQMSCNPAVGGIAKGHLVREIDALGGVMGELTDAVGIQFRLLNTSRGPAVWSPRAQCDKKQYRIRMREWLENEPNLRILQAEVGELLILRNEMPWRVDGRPSEGRPRSPGRGGGGHDRNIPERLGARGRAKVRLRPQRRAAFEHSGRATSHLGLAVDPPEDRNAAASGWADHRLVSI